jgi:hypothetical protein
MSKSHQYSQLVKASFISHAATMPLHWIYSQNDIATKVIGKKISFFDPPSCPYYNYPLGVLSPYGDESIPLLRSVASFGGFDTEDLSNQYFSFFKTYTDSEPKGYVGRLNHITKSY